MVDDTRRSDESGLNEYLAGESDLSKTYREIGDDEPAPSVDALVLSAARAEVETNVLSIHTPRRQWMMPFAVAATVVLSFSIIMSIVFEQPTMVNSVPVTVGPPATAALSDADDRPGGLDKRTALQAREARPSSAIDEAMAADETIGFSARREMADAPFAATDELLKPSLPGRAAAPPAIVAKAEAPETEPARDRDVLLAALRGLAGTAAERERDAASALLSGDALVMTQQRQPVDALTDIIEMFDAGGAEAAFERLDEIAAADPSDPIAELYLAWQRGEL